MIDGQQLAGGSCTPDTFNENPHRIRQVTDIFFPEDDNDPDQVAEAKAICATCPRRPDCLDVHLSEQHGVFGGTTPTERKLIRKERRKS